MSELLSSTNDKVINHVVILIAMEAEGRPYINKLGFQQIENKHKKCPTVMYQGQFHGGLVTVVLNGKDARYKIDNVGTTPGQ